MSGFGMHPPDPDADLDMIGSRPPREATGAGSRGPGGALTLGPSKRVVYNSSDVKASVGGKTYDVIPWVGAAATDGAMFRPNLWHVEPYRKHVEPRARGPLLPRGDTYTALPLVRVVRCAWLDTFGVKRGYRNTLSDAMGRVR